MERQMSEEQARAGVLQRIWRTVRPDWNRSLWFDASAQTGRNRKVNHDAQAETHLRVHVDPAQKADQGHA
jgi:hypothetical protein